jgi:Arm DNA-binding domain
MTNKNNNELRDQDFADSVKWDGHDKRYAFGDGLFLDVKKSGKYWVWSYNGTAVGEGARERIGLGAAKNISLKVARRESLLLDQVLNSGSSPKAHREQLKITDTGSTFTYERAVEGFFDFCTINRWGSESKVMKTVKNNYLLAVAWKNLPLQAVNHLHIAEILMASTRPHRQPDAPLAPLWKAKPKIAKKVQTFLFGMFKYWRAKMKFKGDNPADATEGTPLAELLGKQPAGGHHQDLRVDEIPPLVAFLRQPRRDSNLITSRQLATALGVSPVAIRHARQRHGLKGHKEPGQLRNNASYVYDIAEAERFFKTKLPPITLRSDEYLYTSILEMIILTLARSDMICKLRWDEIKPNYQNSVQGMIIWHKHKTKRFGYTYGTVITRHIQAILDAMKERREREKIDSDYVFAHGPVTYGLNRWINQPSNPNTMEACLRRCIAQIDCIETKDATVHGMRTAFTTWACDMHEYQQDLAMVTIGHHIKGSDADLVYLRNVKKLRQRHKMMTEWGEYCLSQCKLPQPSNVVRLHSR